jgi:Protein of unknown function (DUF3180)
VKPARVSAAVVTAAFTAAIGWLLLDLWSSRGGRTPPQSYIAAVAILVVAAVVLVLGWEVRRSVRGERKPPMNPLAAARVAVLSKAAVYGGAVLTGWYAALALSVLDDATGVRRERLLASAAAAVASAVLVVAGLLAQRWCRLPPDDEDPDGGVDDADVAVPPQRGEPGR